MGEHTKEPLRVALKKQAGDEWWFGGGNGTEVVIYPEGGKSYDSFAVLSGEDEDKAERLAACWNALAGLNPAAVASLIEAAEEVLAYMDVCNDKGDLERNLRIAMTALRGAQ